MTDRTWDAQGPDPTGAPTLRFLRSALVDTENGLAELASWSVVPPEGWKFNELTLVQDAGLITLTYRRGA